MSGTGRLPLFFWRRASRNRLSGVKAEGELWCLSARIGGTSLSFLNCVPVLGKTLPECMTSEGSAAALIGWRTLAVFLSLAATVPASRSGEHRSTLPRASIPCEASPRDTKKAPPKRGLLFSELESSENYIPTPGRCWNENK